MNDKEQRKESKRHGIEMLKGHFDKDPTIYFQLTRYVNGGIATKGYFQCLIIDDYTKTSIPSLPTTIINVSLYVANAIGFRRDKHGAISTRTPSDIVDAIKVACKLEKLNFIRL